MRVAAACLAVTVAGTALARPAEFALTDGDRVVVCGGDLERQLALLDLLETFVATRFPGQRVAFAPAARLDRDLLALRPTVLAILPGTPEPAALEKIQAASPGLRVTSLEPGDDPGPALLTAWKAPPTVAEVEVDARAKRLTRAVNTGVRNLSVDRWIFWSQDDRALPLPAGSSLPAAWNRQVLRVRGLAESRYKLIIDEKPVAVFFRDELEAGISLAALATPMALQAARVKELLAGYGGIHVARWLAWQSPERGTPPWAAAISALDDMEAALLEGLRTAARPETHEFELQPEVSAP